MGINEKPPTAQEEMEYAIDQLQECFFRFCCFKDSFERSLTKSGLISKDDRAR